MCKEKLPFKLQAETKHSKMIYKFKLISTPEKSTKNVICVSIFYEFFKVKNQI